MPATVIAQETIYVGNEVVIEAPAPKPPYLAVFEDDGETGYFYAVDPSKKGDPIQDAVHIYNSQSVLDKAKPSLIQIVWSSDGKKALLLINKYPHAAFDFIQKQAYSRSNFPPPSGEWSKSGHKWQDSVMEHFK